MTSESDETPSHSDAVARGIFLARLALGLAQGVVLYLLYSASDDHSWPATDPYLFAPLLLAALYAPLLVSQAMGTMRLPTLIGWAVLATLICFGLAYDDRFRDPLSVITSDSDLLPEASTFLFGFAGLFIAQSLIAAGDSERRFVARYEAYFDAAWKLGLQLALATVFVAVFWGVLWLGAGLFDLIQLHFLDKLFDHKWFAIPATTLAIAAAIELTDVRARLVAGIRSVVLTLLGWLLPLMALIAAGFLLSLFVTGFAPLWATREAAAGLLVAAGVLVVLINAAYQNGERKPPALMQLSEAVAAIALIPLVLIAGYALMLRVGDYGWTVERIAALACLIVAACYAAGYSAAVVLSLMGGRWLALIERCNILAAFVVLVLLGILFEPLADPANLAVDDQIARLRAGKVSAEQFDYNYVWSEGGRYGRRALEKLTMLKGGGAAATIRERAKQVLTVPTMTAPRPPRPLDIAKNLTVYPKGQPLPKSFVAQNWVNSKSPGVIPACLTTVELRCDAVLADLDGDGADEVIVASNTDDRFWWGTVMKLGADGQWAVVATLPSPHCLGEIEALRAGTYTLTAPPTPVWRNIQIGKHIITLALPEIAPDACPQR
jgi:hypothetical protein